MNIYFLLVCVTALFAKCDSAFVRMFPSIRFQGDSFNVTMGYAHSQCVNLPQNYQRNIASINTNDICVELFSEKDCGGVKIVVYPGTHHYDLTYFDFDKKTMSAKPCDEHIDYRQSNTNTLMFNEGAMYARYVRVDYCENIPSYYSAGNIVSINEHNTCFKYFQMTNCQGPNLNFRKNTDGKVVNQPGLASIASIGRCTSGGANMVFTTSKSASTIPPVVYHERRHESKADNYNGSSNDEDDGAATTAWTIGAIVFIALISGMAFWIYKYKRDSPLIRYVKPSSYY